MAQPSSDQDTEDTELMAIYTKENQGAEKVPQSLFFPVSPSLVSLCTSLLRRLFLLVTLVTFSLTPLLHLHLVI